MENGKVKSNSAVAVRKMDNKLEFTALGDPSPFVFDPDKCSAVVRARAMIHGFTQRIRDAGALSRNPDTGKPASPADKLAAMRRVGEHLMSGSDSWDLPSGAPGVDTGLVIQAIMRVTSKTLEQVETLIEATMTKRACDRAAAIKIWADSKQVAAMVLTIKSERLAAGTKDDVDDLLADIEAE